MTVSKDNGQLTANITNVLKGEDSIGTDGTLVFTNTLLTDLILEKQVEGSTLDGEKRFKFEVTLTDANDKPLEGSYQVSSSEETAETEEKFLDAKDPFVVEVKAGESIKIHGLPLGTKWSIKELDADGYIVTHQVVKESESGTSIDVVESGNASSTLTEKTKVTFINTATYILPETGGMGTNSFIIGGLLLMSVALGLLYNKNCRKCK